MKVGIGTTQVTDSFLSGKKLAQDALHDGQITKPAFAIAFCNSDVHEEQLLAGILEILGANVPVIGGSGVGIISNSFLSYTNGPAGIVIIEDDELQIQEGHALGLGRDARQTGQQLAQQFDINPNDKLLLFYDSVRQPAGINPPVMNSSVRLLKGLEESCKYFVPVFGGGTIGDYNFSNSIQFSQNTIHSQSASALLLRHDKLSLDHTIMHGCSPKDGIYHTITKIEEAVIYELDGRPVVEVINEIYGNENWQGQVPLKRLALGVNHKEKYWKEYFESDFLNRLILSVLPDKSGILIFEPDFQQGSEVLFMLRDSRVMIESAEKNTANLIEKIKGEGKQPIWGLYIDCAGRTALFSETLSEEASEVQNIFNTHGIPLFGFYSGVEIAPSHGKNLGLDWTGVLVIFSKLP